MLPVGELWCLLVFLIVQRSVDGLSSISENRRHALNVSLTLTCGDDGPITNDVNFLQDSSIQGSCIPNCGTGVTGYAVSQNKTARETYLTIVSLDNTRDCGNWTCKQGTGTESTPLRIQCPIPCFLHPSTDITVTPPVSSLSSAENISVEVTVSCCSQTAVINWTLQKQDGSSVPLPSSSTTESSSCTGGDKQTLNTFQPLRNGFPTSGKVNLTLSIEHDSFNPPDYTVVFTKEIDLGAPESECGFPLIAVIILAILLVVKVVTDVLFVLYRWGGFFTGISVQKVYILYWSCFVQGIVDCVFGVIFFIVTCAVCTERLDEPLATGTLALSIIVIIIGAVNMLLCCRCYKSPGEVDGKPGSNAGGPRPWLCCCCPQSKICSGEESRQSPPAPIPAAMASPRKPVPPNSTSARPLPSPTSDPASDSAVNPKVLLEPLNVEEPKKKKKRRKKRKSTKEAAEESTEQTMTAAGDSDDD